MKTRMNAFLMTHDRHIATNGVRSEAENENHVLEETPHLSWV